jgi:hypothetical protein
MDSKLLFQYKQFDGIGKISSPKGGSHNAIRKQANQIADLRQRSGFFNSNQPVSKRKPYSGCIGQRLKVQPDDVFSHQ